MSVKKIIIIGKASNLSQHLNDALENTELISARDILSGTLSLEQYENYSVKLIFNAFWPATQLNNFSNPVAYTESALLATAKALDFFQKINIEKIIYTSSASVYGESSYCSEQNSLLPTTYHSSLKVSNEKLIESFCSENDIDYTIVRLFNMYGGNDKFSIISKIINAVNLSNDINLINNGSAIRDYIHIDDVVRVYKRLLMHNDINIINVASGRGVSIRFILEYLSKQEYSISTKSLTRTEISSSIASTKLLRKIIDVDSFESVEKYLLSNLIR